MGNVGAAQDLRGVRCAIDRDAYPTRSRRAAASSQGHAQKPVGGALRPGIRPRCASFDARIVCAKRG